MSILKEKLIAIRIENKEAHQVRINETYGALHIESATLVAVAISGKSAKNLAACTATDNSSLVFWLSA